VHDLPPLGLIAPCDFCGVGVGQVCLDGCDAQEPPFTLPDDLQRIYERLLAERRQTMARWKPNTLPKPAPARGDLTQLAREVFPHTGRGGGTMT